MKFSTKLTLTILSLLAAALCALGLAMVGRSFYDQFTASAESAAVQQSRDAAAIEQNAYRLAGASTRPGAAPAEYFPVTLAVTAAQNYAEQNTGSLALYVDAQYAAYSSLPTSISRTKQLAVLGAGGARYTVYRGGGAVYLLLASPLVLPGGRYTLLSAYSVSGVYASRDAQLAAWLMASLAVLVLGGAVVHLVSRGLTAPLTKLQAASGRIAAGDYAGRTEIAADDEIGTLSRSFDAMAGAVQEKVDALNLSVQQQRDFVAAFSHEIKTPMTGMLGYADLMRARPQSPVTQKEAADVIYHETKRLESLSQKLLALMGLDATGAVAPRPVRDAALFAETRRSLALNAGAPVGYRPGGCTVRVDRALWVDLLRNLILNGQRACAGRAEGRVEVACRAEGSTAVFTVADNGCGIPAKDLPRITEPFYMVDKSRARQGGGSGIGLALCRRIAELHGCRMEIESRAAGAAGDTGTVVTLRLPLAGKEDADENES